MKLYLIRHLPTKWNLAGKLQGRRNIPIDENQLELFRNSITNNIKKLSEMTPFDLVLASSLDRTKQTAAIYHYFPINEPLLDELDFGIYEGRCKKQLMQDFKDEWYNHPENLELGEPLTTLEERILMFLNKYQHYEKVLVFGHGSWIRALLSIRDTGNINKMNHLKLENNQLIELDISTYNFNVS